MSLAHCLILILTSEFVDMLNEMRFGKLSSESIQTFRGLSRSIDYDDGIGPTELYVTPSTTATLQPLICPLGSPAAKMLSAQTRPEWPA